MFQSICIYRIGVRSDGAYLHSCDSNLPSDIEVVAQSATDTLIPAKSKDR